MISHYLRLPFATQITYLLLIIAVLINAFMAVAPRMKTHWRICFVISASVLGVYVLYIALRLAGILDAKDYAVLVQWLFPLLMFPLVTPPLLIHWESTYYRKALEKKQESL